ncbi:MAG TPA: HAD family hydrolase, partial [Desulfocapsa sulfexigens]|nr:HAD family hydrolase [Desulfocapsa sulfexigens]
MFPTRCLEEAGHTITSLKKLGLKKIGILSGDHEKSVNLVGKSVGIANLWSGLQPDDKLQVITTMQAQGAGVIFVGDGINDAPPL